jgi:hypothetical protein
VSKVCVFLPEIAMESTTDLVTIAAGSATKTPCNSNGKVYFPSRDHLDQLYTEVQGKNWTVTNPYTESIWLYKHLYQDRTMRDNTSLSKREKGILAKVEKQQNPFKAPVGLSTIYAEALAQGKVDQPFLVKLNHIVSIFTQIHNYPYLVPKHSMKTQWKSIMRWPMRQPQQCRQNLQPIQ